MTASLNNLKLYYFVAGTIGRSIIIRLFLEEHKINYEFVTMTDSNWPELKAKLQAEKTFDQLPMLETAENKKYFGAIPIVRFLSRELGLTRKDKDEEHLVESVTDYASDWHVKIAPTVFGSETESALEQYAKEDGPINRTRFERVYSTREGPYLLGNELTYADLYVFQCLLCDGITDEKLKEYPNLAKLRAAIQNRPNLKAYLASL